MNHTKQILLFTLLSLRVFGQTAWTDPESGRSYLMLDGLVTYERALGQCHSQGYALLDLRYLSEAERAQFEKSAEFENLQWEKRYPGTVNEAELSHLWQSAQFEAYSSNSKPITSAVTYVRKNNTLARNTSWHDGSTHLANAVCMTVPSFWFRCSVDFKCTFEATPPYSIRYGFSDFGGTEHDAVRRIVERTQDPRFAITEAKCTLHTETTRCLQMVPN